MPRKGELDPLWELFKELTGTEPITKSERGRWNKAIKELRDAGITPGDVRERARVYREKWPQLDLTPTGLASNWSRLQPPKRYAPAAPVEDPPCVHGVPGFCPSCRQENRKRLASLIDETFQRQGQGKQARKGGS